MLILLNFKDHPASVNTGIDLTHAKLLLDNYPDAPKSDDLRPYEAVVYELQPD
jgi:oligo-1,6-glucosidase